VQIEQEIKFRLPASAARRLWRLTRRAAPPRQRNVTSVYYDTPKQHLRRHGVSIRLRRDGTRWLQTLKLEAAPSAGFSARAEWEFPAPRGELDAIRFPREEILAATGLDLARLPGKLRPLFETRFVRRSAAILIDGATRAEISVDRGHVAAGGRSEEISEVELELKAGDAESLLRYAGEIAAPLGLELEFESKAERGYRLAAGEEFPRPRKWRRPSLGALATPSEAFSAICMAALAQAGANARGVAHASDPEYLHQMRVGLRRLRSALRAFRALVPKKAEKPVVTRLRALAPPLGAARDWDVFCEGLVRISAQEPERAPPLGQLLARARGKRAGARRLARAAAGSPKMQAFLLRALRWLSASPWRKRAGGAETSLARFAATALDSLQRKALKEADGIDWADMARRHQLRIRIKRLRYGCDFFAASFAGALAQPYLKRLAALQDILGDLNDIAVARRLLTELAPRGSPADLSSASAYVARTLGARERTVVISLQPAWKELEKRRPFWASGR
jgi:inorganic triphosphatase YgiF